MWTEYFKMKKVLRGRIITPSHGELDFRRDNIPVETCMQLYESDFPYLELTELGKEVLYGHQPIQINPDQQNKKSKKYKRP